MDLSTPSLHTWVNYRANLWSLHDKGVKNIIAVAAVGGIHKQIDPTHDCHT